MYIVYKIDNIYSIYYGIGTPPVFVWFTERVA